MNPSDDGAPGRQVHLLHVKPGQRPEEKLAASAALATLLDDSLHGLRSPLVVVKPNWVQEGNETDPEVWEPTITSPDVILAVIEMLAARLESGTICLCDGPHSYADFEAILKRGNLARRLDELRDRFPQVTIEVLDLRRDVWIQRDGVIVERRRNPPDPRGYVSVDLGRESMLFGRPREGRYYGADFESREVNGHHRGEVHEYLLAGTAVACDLFVNIPKLKTHKKTGITCSLKNLVGINGERNWLPHHTEGSPDNGGDEHPGTRRLSQLDGVLRMSARQVAARLPGIGEWAYGLGRKIGRSVFGDSTATIRNGNWEGNDTCWRMALDLNRAFLYSSVGGRWGEVDQRRRHLTVVDGVIGGEGDGPLSPRPVRSNVLIFGVNPAAIDLVACRVMGFDYNRIPLVHEAFAPHRWPIAACSPDQVVVFDERVAGDVPAEAVQPAVPDGFRPHFGWPSIPTNRGTLDWAGQRR